MAIEQRRAQPSPAATLGPACGLIGGQVGMEVMHLLTGLAEPATLGVAHIYDLRTMEVKREPIVPEPDCPVCGHLRHDQPSGRRSTGSFRGVRRLAATIALAVLAAALLAACGGSSTSETAGTTGSSPNASGASVRPRRLRAQLRDRRRSTPPQLRATAVSCGEARAVMFAWQQSATAAPPRRAPRAPPAPCAATAASAPSRRRGLAVSCARQGHAIAFIAKRG